MSKKEKKKYNVLHQKLMRILNKKADKRKQKEIKESKAIKIYVNNILAYKLKICKHFCKEFYVNLLGL